MKKRKFMKLESSDGEIHFQECKSDFCSKALKYNEREALAFAKKEANKTLLVKREY